MKQNGKESVVMVMLHGNRLNRLPGEVKKFLQNFGKKTQNYGTI
jgi:hypothetical protein